MIRTVPLYFIVSVFVWGFGAASVSGGMFDDILVDQAPPQDCAITNAPMATGSCGDASCEDDHSDCGDTHSDCGDTHDEAEGSEETSHEGHNHAAHETTSIFALSDEERSKNRCEHDMATADCRDCSSEVGVVHVSAEMTSSDSTDSESLIGTTVVEEIPVDDIVETVGQIALPESDTAHISPRVAGTITKVFANLGDQVKTGDRLFQLVSTEIGRAAAAYEKASALVRLARQELIRGQKMQKLKVTSDKEVFRLSYELEQANIEKTSARKELEILGISERDIDSKEAFAELSRGIVTVKAPVEGSVTEKHAVIGEVISPGETILIISDLSKLWVWAKVYDGHIGLVLANRAKLKNREAKISVAPFPEQTFKGVIDYMSPIIDTETRTLNLRLTVSNDDGKLLPGMFCRIQLPLGHHTIVSVPRYSVLNDGETHFVFVPFGPNRFAAKEVKTGAIHGNRLPVLKGLKAGDSIVTRGTFILKSEVLKDRMGAG